MTDLMPCPFCGNDELSHGYDMTTASVQCHECDAFVTAPTEPEAITAWNTRQPTPATLSTDRIREIKAAAFIEASGKRVHSNDCATSNAPGMEPRPCDCSPPAADEVEAVARVIFPEAWRDRERFQAIIAGTHKRMPTDVMERAMMVRSATRRVDTVVAPSLRVARTAIAAMQARPAEPAGEEPVELLTGDPDHTDCDGPNGGGRFANPARPATPANPDRLVERWRAIDSAPRDGSWFLACDAIDGAHYAAAWDGDENFMAKCGQHVTETPQPTHWMPLPAAPSAAQDQGEG